MKPFVALLLAAALLPAQAPKKQRRSVADAPAPGLVIRQIEVKGNKRFSPQQVIEISGLRSGQLAEEQTFEAARDRILATGCFETIAWRYQPIPAGGMKAEIEVSEADQFLPWVIDRLPISSEDFARVAAANLACFGKEIPTTERYLNATVRVLEKALAEKGFKEPVVARVNLVGRDQVSIVFQPKQPAPVVAEVRFRNAGAIPEQYLRREATRLARGVPFSEVLFRQMLDNQIRSMYEAIGRLQVKFGAIATEPAKDVIGVVVTVDLEEGPLFTLKDVSVTGVHLDTSEIEDLGKFKRGEPASYSEIALAMERIFTKLKKEGYFKPTYNAKRALNEEEKTVRLMLGVDPGPRYFMGKLNLVGLDVVSEPVIRKMWTMKSGDPYNADYPDLFLKTVRERGVFDNLGETKAVTKTDDDRHTVDVTLTFGYSVQPLDSRDKEQEKRRQ